MVHRRTSLEAEAYAAYMVGNLAFHREEHTLALEKFTTARRIYSDLSQVGTQSQKELFQTLVDELDPFIRFSQHRLQLQGKLKQGSQQAFDWSSSGDSASNALLQSKIDMVLLESRKQKVATLATVQWKQKQIAVPSQELGLALLRPDEVIAKLAEIAPGQEKQRDKLFLELLSCYDSLLQMIKQEVARLEQLAKSGSALVHTDIELLQSLEEYARYLKLTKQVDQIVVVYKELKAKATPSGELTHVLDMLIQYVSDILAIPGLGDHESLLAARYSAYQAVFRSIRASTAAQSYLEDSKFAEALSLYQFASGFLNEGEEVLANYPAANDSTLATFVTDLRSELEGAQSRTTAQSFLERSKRADAIRAQLKLNDVKPGSASANVPKQPSLLERQQDYSSGTTKGLHEILRLPPSFQAITCKPLLFDIAFNELDFPDISERTKSDEEKQAEAAAAAQQANNGGGGLFGWFRK